MIPNDRSYRLGLHEVADGVHAYLQPDGGWGLSNAGLVVGEGQSLLVDTLFDLRLTGEMLDHMRAHTDRSPIATLVNTHANGDHCYGNELVEGAEIVTTTATAEEMGEVSPATLAALTAGGHGETADAYLREAFGAFEFDGIEVPEPTRTFDERLELEAGGRPVRLYEVGPAHTRGDLLAHVPDAGVVFSGDILFVYGTPIVWAGPVSNYVAACDAIVDLEPELIVPGHGPVTDHSGVRMVRNYLLFVEREATARHEAGMSVLDAARDIDLGEYADWGEAERLVLNVDAVYRELDPGYESPGLAAMFGLMAELA